MNEKPDMPIGREISLAVCLEKYRLTVDENQELILVFGLWICLIFLIENPSISHNLSINLRGLSSNSHLKFFRRI